MTRQDEGLISLISDLFEGLFTKGVAPAATGKGKIIDVSKSTTSSSPLYLPSNPYTYCIPKLTLAEAQRTLPDREDPIPPSKVQEIDPLTSITGLIIKQRPRSPFDDDEEGEDGGLKRPIISAYGLPHVIKYVKARDVRRMERLINTMDQALAKTGQRIRNLDKDYQVDTMLAVVGPAATWTNFAPVGEEAKEVTLDVHVLVRGPELEKAINVYIRKIIIEALGASTHKNTTAVCLHTSYPIRTTTTATTSSSAFSSSSSSSMYRKWSNEEIQTAQAAFASAVKAATIARGEIILEMVTRVTMEEKDGMQATAEEGVGGNRTHLVHVKRRYTFQYCDDKGGPIRSYAMIPLVSFFDGWFFRQDHALQYASIHLAPQATAAASGTTPRTDGSSNKAQNKKQQQQIGAAAPAASSTTPRKTGAGGKGGGGGGGMAGAKDSKLMIKEMIEQARSDYVISLCRAEASCSHLKLYQHMLPLALYDCHGKDHNKETINQVLLDILGMVGGTAGYYHCLRSKAQVMFHVVSHHKTNLEKAIMEAENEIQNHAMMDGGERTRRRRSSVSNKTEAILMQLLVNITSWMKTLHQSFSELRDQVWEITIAAEGQTDAGSYACSESMSLAAPLQYCLLAMTDESVLAASSTQGTAMLSSSVSSTGLAQAMSLHSLLTVIARFLNKLSGLLDTLESSLAWDTRQALYDEERERLEESKEKRRASLVPSSTSPSKIPSKQAAATPGQSPPKRGPAAAGGGQKSAATASSSSSIVLGGQGAVRVYCYELHRIRAAKLKAAAAKVKNEAAGGGGGSRGGRGRGGGSLLNWFGGGGTTTTKTSTTTTKALTNKSGGGGNKEAQRETLPAFSSQDEKLGGWAESLLKMFWRTNCQVVDVEAEIQRKLEDMIHGTGRKLPEVILREALLLSYAVDTRLDMTMTKFITEVMTGTLNTIFLPIFTRRLSQSAVWLELWTQATPELLASLKPKASDFVRIGVAEKGVARNRKDDEDDDDDGEEAKDELLCHTDAQNRLYGTRPALLWCNARRVQELLQELAFFRTLPSGATKLSTSIAIAARGETVLEVGPRSRGPQAQEFTTPASPSMLEFQVLFHVSYAHTSQEGLAHAIYSDYVLRKIIGWSQSVGQHHLIVGLAVGGGKACFEWREEIKQSTSVGTSALLSPASQTVVFYPLDQLMNGREFEVAKTYVQRSPQQAALHCIMHVLDPSTLEMIYQPAIIRFALLKSGPSALMGGEVGERDTIMLCTVDPAMAFECVFTERLEAAQLLNYLQEFESSRRCPGLVRNMWKEELMQRVGQSDDQGDVLSIYKTYAQSYCIMPGKYEILLPCLARMLKSLAQELYALGHMCMCLETLLSNEAVSVIEKAKLNGDDLKRQTWSFIARVGAALTSPQQVHFHGLAQYVVILLHRFYQVLCRRWGEEKRSKNIDVAGQRVLIPSMLSKLNEENNLDTDLKDVTKLLRELRDALSHFRYAVSHDIHMNCPTVETCIVADTTAA